MKKFTLLLLTLLLSVSWVFAAGGSQRSTGAAAASAPLLTDDRSKTLDIIWWGPTRGDNLPLDGSIVQRELERRYNIRITNVPIGQYNTTQANLFLASGYVFDVYIGMTARWTGDLRHRVNTGTIRPIPLEYMTRFAPGMVSMLANESSNWALLGSVDGVFYGPPLMGEPSLPLGLALRTDWLRNLGVTTLPTTLDELENLLARFRTDDPDRNGQRDTWALGVSGNMANVAPYLFASYGVQINRWAKDTDGSPKWYAIDDNYRQALLKMREWWSREIYDPQILVNQTRDRFVDGLVGGFFGDDYSLVYNAGNNTSNWYYLAQSNPNLDPATISTLIPPVRGPNGAYTYVTDHYLKSWPTTFGRNTSDEKVVRVLSMLNDILTQRDLYLLANYGIQGQQWDFDSTGTPVLKPEWNNPEKQTELGMARFLDYSFIPPDFLPLFFGASRMAAYNATRVYPSLPLHFASLFTTEEDTEYSSGAQTIADEYFWKVVTGEWDINSTWNDYVSRWRNAGGQRIIDAKKRIAAQLGLN